MRRFNFLKSGWKKLICFAFLLHYSAPLNAQAVWNNSSFVHRSGKSINDGSGNAVKLEGVNLGGWLSWEGWIWGSGYTSETTIYTKIKNKLGQAAADNFRDSVYQNFISRNDIKAISEQCFNVVRIPFNHLVLEDDSNPYVYKPEGWAILDSVLAWCEAYNVYAVIDMHATPGGQANIFTADPDSPDLWSVPDDQNRTVQLWKAIADRYKNRGIIAGYDLLNEPAPPSDSALNALYDIIIDSIRSVDNNHMLFIEGKSSATNFTGFNALIDSNMLFEFHFYTWFIADIPNALVQYTTLAQSFNVPVWCGEWGENNYSTLDTTLSYLQKPSSLFSGTCFWTWKKHINGSSYPYYEGIDSSATWDKSIKWIGNGFAPQPTVGEMQQGIADFITNMKIANCFLNGTMNTVLTACTPASVKEILNNRKELHLYPNPANQFVHLTLPQSNSIATGTVTIYNSLGQKTDIFEVPAKQQDYEIELGKYTNGVYYILFDADEVHYSSMITVTK